MCAHTHDNDTHTSSITATCYIHRTGVQNVNVKPRVKNNFTFHVFRLLYVLHFNKPFNHRVAQLVQCHPFDPSTQCHPNDPVRVEI